MHSKFLILSAISGVVLLVMYNHKMRGLLGLSDDVETTFFGQTVSIQGPSGYCGVRSKDVPVVDCQRAQVTDSERFDVIKTSDCVKRPDGRTECQVAFRNKLSGKVCGDEGNRVLCTRNVPGPWEKFGFVKQAGLREFSLMGGKSGTARKACQDKGAGGMVCDGGKEAFGTNAVFRWLLASDASTAAVSPPAPSPVPSAASIPTPAPSPPSTTAVSTTAITNTITEIAKAVIAANTTPPPTAPPAPLPSSATVPSPSAATTSPMTDTTTATPPATTAASPPMTTFTTNRPSAATTTAPSPTTATTTPPPAAATASLPTTTPPSSTTTTKAPEATASTVIQPSSAAVPPPETAVTKSAITDPATFSTTPPPPASTVNGNIEPSREIATSSKSAEVKTMSSASTTSKSSTTTAVPEDTENAQDLTLVNIVGFVALGLGGLFLLRRLRG
jgi:hypothetical protein